MKIYWLYLALGIVFEVLGTVSMKLAEGFTKLWPSVFVFYGLSLGLLGIGFRKI